MTFMLNLKYMFKISSLEAVTAGFVWEKLCMQLLYGHYWSETMADLAASNNKISNIKKKNDKWLKTPF